ncbi:MAG: CvpA family protein [Candidatus Binatia bacterium]
MSTRVNAVDLVLALLLLLWALRGYWRGFFRESFGLVALLGGLAAAIQFAAVGAAVLQQRFRVPAPVDAGVAFVAIFLVVHTLVNLVGVLLDRLAGALFLRGINRLAGAAFGAGKGAAILGLLLLFVHLFPIVPELDAQIMSSAIGRPLVTAAGGAVRFALQASPHAAAERQT